MKAVGIAGTVSGAASSIKGICEEADRLFFVWTKKNQGVIIYVPAYDLLYAVHSYKVTHAAR